MKNNRLIYVGAEHCITNFKNNAITKLHFGFYDKKTETEYYDDGEIYNEHIENIKLIELSPVYKYLPNRNFHLYMDYCLIDAVIKNNNDNFFRWEGFIRLIEKETYLYSSNDIKWLATNFDLSLSLLKNYPIFLLSSGPTFDFNFRSLKINTLFVNNVPIDYQQTMYNYINAGLFLKLKYKNLDLTAKYMYEFYSKANQWNRYVNLNYTFKSINDTNNIRTEFMNIYLNCCFNSFFKKVSGKYLFKTDYNLINFGINYKL